MSVGVLIITHEDIGGALLKTAKDTFGQLPLTTVAVSINNDIDPTLSLAKLKRVIQGMQHCDGVLILTDLFGSTPSNLAQALSDEVEVQVVSGLNLPMLFRVMNYPNLCLDKLVEKALSGGREGVLNCAECVA